jgi:hypothetical protein
LLGPLTKGESALSPADVYMQFAVYDLIGALFSPSDPLPVARPTDKLFARICGVIRSGFSYPDFGPVEVAAAAGISLRYLQKLFTERPAPIPSAARWFDPAACSQNVLASWTQPGARIAIDA